MQRELKSVLLILIIVAMTNSARSMDCYKKTGEFCPVQNKEFSEDTDTTDCGFFQSPQMCPIGGDDSAVALVIDGRIECTGVLISPKLVLTAAHCLNDGIKSLTDDAGPQVTDAKHYGIYWGNGIFGGMVDKKEIATVASVHPFPKYPKGLDSDGPDACYECDIAVIVLEQSHPEKSRARLPTVEDMKRLNRSTVFEQVGYGSVDYYRSRDHSLKGVKHFISSRFSKWVIEDKSGRYDDRFASLIYTKNIGEVDAGSGDSGGPLLLKTNSGSIVFGVLGGSADNHVTRYAATISFAEWILSFDKK